VFWQYNRGMTTKRPLTAEEIRDFEELGHTCGTDLVTGEPGKDCNEKLAWSWEYRGHTINTDREIRQRMLLCGLHGDKAPCEG
jgi:hypothetical protein